MTDIVERLSKYGSGYPDGLLLMREAADEIERLRAALRAIVHPDNASLVWFAPSDAHAMKLRDDAIKALGEQVAQ